MAGKISAKQLAIDKANSTMVIILAVASFITIFSLVASKSLLSQRSYQSRVIEQKEIARDQVEKNLEEVKKLKASYDAFEQQSPNLLGGNPQGTGNMDGSNPKIIIDALPVKYDYPALLSSLEKMLNERNYQITGLEGKDDELAQSQNTQSASPQATEMPFSVTVRAGGSATKDILDIFERSIRPMQIQRIVISDEANDPEIVISGKTYFQPIKNFNAKSEAFK